MADSGKLEIMNQDIFKLAGENFEDNKTLDLCFNFIISFQGLQHWKCINPSG